PPACADGATAQSASTISATNLPTHAMRGAIVASLSARPIVGIGRRAVRIPAAFLPQIAHEIAQVGFAQDVFVRGHARSTVADFRLDGVVVDLLAGDEICMLIKPGELGNVLGVLVVTEPALVIEDFLPALGSALRSFAEFINLQRALIR